MPFIPSGGMVPWKYSFNTYFSSVYYICQAPVSTAFIPRQKEFLHLHFAWPSIPQTPNKKHLFYYLLFSYFQISRQGFFCCFLQSTSWSRREAQAKLLLHLPLKPPQPTCASAQAVTGQGNAAKQPMVGMLARPGT